MIPTGRQNIFTKTVLAGAAVNVIMNAMLIPIFKANGAAVASVVAETTIAVIQLVLVRNELDGIQVLKLLPKYLISGGVMLASLLWLNQYLKKKTAILKNTNICVNFALNVAIERKRAKWSRQQKSAH